MKETAIVTEIQGKTIKVKSLEQEGCKSCKSPFCSVKDKSFTAYNKEDLPLREGDWVRIYLETSRTIGSSFLVLIFPLILFFVFFFIADRGLHIKQELIQVLFGAAGIALGFAVSFVITRSSKNNRMPRVIEIVEKAPGTVPACE